MQEVYRNGALGEIIDFSNEALVESLKKDQVDHVRIFNKETGNKIGLNQVDEKTIEDIVERKLLEHEQREKLRSDYKILTSEFDRIKHNSGRG